MQIRSVMTSYCLQLKSGKYWINNISGNIEAVFLKLGTTNVHQKRNKMTPLVPLPWQQFCRWCCVNKNRNSLFCLKTRTICPSQSNDGMKTIWELCLLETGPFGSRWRLQMGTFTFLTERDWSRKGCYGNSTKGVILFLFWCTFVVPSFKNTASIFPAYFVEPRISSKSVKSPEIHKNTWNPTKFARNLTKYISAQHNFIWKLSWLLL